MTSAGTPAEFQLRPKSSISSSRSGSIHGQRKAGKKRQNKWRKILKIFHPAVLTTAIIFGFLSWRLHYILTTENWQTESRTESGGQLSRRIIFAPTREMMSRSEFEQIRKHGMENIHHRTKRYTPSKFPNFKSERPVPRSILDDILLDAEMPVVYKSCLSYRVVKALEDAETVARQRLPRLSEHLEYCDTNDDCLQISPFKWTMSGANTTVPCRKRTYLRCNSTSNECICQDRYDLRWDTEVVQHNYQWNPVTKTCYVRGTNPCKMEVPCAPGTTCRATASISYNTPPIQRLCECTDIGLTVTGANLEWWYCKQYWQRSWLFDLDNIKKWRHPAYHLFTRIIKMETYNATNETSGEKTDWELDQISGITNELYTTGSTPAPPPWSPRKVIYNF